MSAKRPAASLDIGTGVQAVRVLVAASSCWQAGLYRCCAAGAVARTRSRSRNGKHRKTPTNRTKSVADSRERSGQMRGRSRLTVGIWSLDHRGGFDLCLKVECDGETESRQNDVGSQNAGRMIANTQWATESRLRRDLSVRSIRRNRLRMADAGFRSGSECCGETVAGIASGDERETQLISEADIA